jgi:hypothetical protein
VKLTSTEQMVVREAEEARGRALRGLEHGDEPIMLAQDLAAAGELYMEAATLIATRARAAAKKARVA